MVKHRDRFIPLFYSVDGAAHSGKLIPLSAMGTNLHVCIVLTTICRAALINGFCAVFFFFALLFFCSCFFTRFLLFSARTKSIPCENLPSLQFFTYITIGIRAFFSFCLAGEMRLFAQSSRLFRLFFPIDFCEWTHLKFDQTHGNANIYRELKRECMQFSSFVIMVLASVCIFNFKLMQTQNTTGRCIIYNLWLNRDYCCERDFYSIHQDSSTSATTAKSNISQFICRFACHVHCFITQCASD